MKFSNNKEISLIVKKLVMHGWMYRVGGRHGKIISPQGRKLAVPTSPSDYRASQNFKHDVRRINKLDWELNEQR